MNRKQLRRERRINNRAGRLRHRERIERNRRIWCNELGEPTLVMDDPSEEHVKALLMRWLAPRSMMTDINAEVHSKMKERVQLRVDSLILQTLTEQMEQYQFPPGWSDSLREMLGRMSTFGATVEPPAPTVKIW